MMCNLVCSSMGRHVHIDYCRTEEATPCEGPEIQHLDTRMIPDPERPKDAVTHSLYWRRMGTLDICFFGFRSPQVNIRLQVSKVIVTLALSGTILKLRRPIYSRRANQFHEMVCFTSWT